MCGLPTAQACHVSVADAEDVAGAVVMTALAGMAGRRGGNQAARRSIMCEISAGASIG